MGFCKSLLISFLRGCVLVQSLSLPTDQTIHEPNDTQPLSLPSSQNAIGNISVQSPVMVGYGPIIPDQFSFDAFQTAAKSLQPHSFMMNVLDLMAQLARPDYDPAGDRKYSAHDYENIEVELVNYQGRLEKRYAIWGLFNLLVLNGVNHQPFYIQSLMVLYWKEGDQARQRVGAIAIRARQPGLESVGGSDNVTLSKRSSPPLLSMSNSTDPRISESSMSTMPDQDSTTNASGPANAPQFNTYNLIYSDRDISPTKVFVLACGLITSIFSHDANERPLNGMQMYIPVINATVTYAQWPAEKTRRRPPYWTYGNAPIGLALGGRGFLTSGEFKEMTTVLRYGKTDLAAAQFLLGDHSPHSSLQSRAQKVRSFG